MNKITTKLRTLGRLSVWVSISFGIAIATSQTANAWKAINNIDDNIYITRRTDSGYAEFNHDGELALGHTVSCGQDSNWCGSGKGQDIFVTVPLVGAVRLQYPAVHVPPNGVVIFGPGYYTTSDDELYPSNVQIPMPTPICQQYYWTLAYLWRWLDRDMSLCDQALDRHRVP